MALATEDASLDRVTPSEVELGQPRPSGTSPTSYDPAFRELQTDTGFQFEHPDPDEISRVEEPIHPNEPPRDSHDTSPANDASAMTVTRRHSTSTSRSSTDSPNLDNPLALFETTEELDRAISYFAFNHGLKELLDALKRAARAERDEIEVSKDPNISAEEKTALEKGRDAPFLKQSRSLRGAVLVVGTLSGMCQGWAQSVLNGSGICANEESSIGCLTLISRVCHSRILRSSYS